MAKTLPTGILPQLRDDTLDKLKRIQDILKPQVNDDSSKERDGVEDARTTSHEQAPHPRVPTCPPRVAKYDYALSPRVPISAPMDTSEWVLSSRTEIPQRDIRQPKFVQGTQHPRRSPRLAEKIKKLRLDVGFLQRPSEEETQQLTRIAELKEKRKAAAEDAKRCTVIANPRQKGIIEVRTLQHKLVLACIQTYAEVTGRKVLPSNLSQRRFPTEVLNAVLNKDTGELMEMQQLLQNPKYSELWGKSYTKELGRLVQGVP
jgi:hypothetical protein